MKKKFVLPMMAFVFAIGLSFATESSTADPAQDWIFVENTMRPISEVDCGEGIIACEVQFVEDGPIHLIYDAENSDLDDPKTGSGGTIELWK